MRQTNTPTFSDALIAFADQLIGEKHPATTTDAYVGDVRRWIAWLATVTVAATPRNLAREDVEEYKTHLAREDGAQATTIRRKLASLRRFTQFLVDRGYAATAVADRVKSPKIGSRDPNFLTDKEYKAMLFEAQRKGRPRDYAMLQLLVQTGLRVGELVRLRLTDIDWTIPQLLVKGRKNGVDTNVPLERQAVASLSAYLAIRPASSAAEIFLSKSER